MLAVLNPGHAPDEGDPGACGVYSTEADIVKLVADELQPMLEEEGIEVMQTRHDELMEVCAEANEAGADMFISIHCNAAENHEATGTETFYWEYGDESYQLAELVQNALVRKLFTDDRGLKDGQWLCVLKHTDAAATILVELGFISNEEEENMLNGRITDMAMALHDAIVQYSRERGLIE